MQGAAAKGLPQGKGESLLMSDGLVDPSQNVWRAIIKRLRESPAVLAAFGEFDLAVWRDPPADGLDGDKAYPYLQVGEIQVLGLERLDYGDIVDDPSEVFVTLHAKSRPGRGGSPMPPALIRAARGALMSPDLELEPLPNGESFRLVLGEFRDTRHFTDQDGQTAHSVSTPRFEIEPTEGG